ncbi:MAG: diguanylate cyclase [Candidatus Sumerlaeaceae bacterium]
MANLLLRSEKMHSLAQSCKNLAQASARDPLTGLFNHGTVLKALDNEYQRASRSKSPLSCLMLDIDHFKALNDTYGHRFGDWVLKELAVLLRNQVRATDIVGRYGGEEFLFVLPATDEEGALRLAEKIRLAVEERSFRRGDFQVLVTVSIGLASTSAEMGRGAEHLLQLSDRALYFAKENGRNRVASAHAHLSMLDFEPFGHKQSPLKHAEPVIALCSTDNSFVQRVAQLANRNKYILLVFEKSQEFFGALEALEPDVALVDRAEDLASPDFVRQLTARLHKHRVAVGRVIESNGVPGTSSPIKDADFYIDRSTSDLMLGETLRLVLYWTTFERDLAKMRMEVGQMRRRLRQRERLATLGELAKMILDELSWVVEQQEDLKNTGYLAPESRASRCEALRQKLVQLSEHLEHPRHTSQPLAVLLRRAFALAHDADNRKSSVSPSITVENTIPDEIEVFVDEELFLYALTELLANSVEAMPEGGHLRFSARREGLLVELVIEDNGHGMQPSGIARIYEPYYTTHSERNALGLGIPVANAIFREHGATLQFSSTPAGGTRALIRIPLGEADEELTLRWHRA